MHAIHFFDRRPLVAALGALALTGVTAAGAAALSQIDLGGDERASTAPAASLPTPPAPSTQPVWVTEPLAPPAIMR